MIFQTWRVWSFLQLSFSCAQIELEFTDILPESANLIILGSHQSLLEIDEARRVSIK